MRMRDIHRRAGAPARTAAAVAGAILLIGGTTRAADGPGCVVAPWGIGEGNLRSEPTLARNAVPGPPALAPAAPSGELNLLVILAEFADVPHRADPARFQDLLFGPDPSVRGYFQEVSGGRLDVGGDIVGWVTLPQTKFYYSAGQAGVGAYPNNGQKMAEDAVRAAVQAGVNLAPYDGDGDGAVDAVLVIHSGQGYEWAGATVGSPSTEPDPGAINSHKWVVQQQDYGVGTRVVDYFTCPELQLVKATVAPGWADSVSTIGVYCHELGHVLGLPDFYDTSDLSNHVGVWGIMDYGTWNRIRLDPAYSAPGALPGHFSAWSKEFLGWTVAAPVAPGLGEATEQRVTLESTSGGGFPLQLRANPNGVDWGPTATGSGEFFLAEVRTREGYDAGLPAEGLILYHVDESRPSNNASTNSDGGGLMKLVPQDGTTTISPNDTTDPWPGTQSEFGPASIPDSDLYGGSPSGVTLSEFGTLAAGTVTMTAEVVNLSTDQALPLARPNPFRPARHGRTALVLSLGAAPLSPVAVQVFDLRGRLVRTLTTDTGEDAGGRVAYWDGCTDSGRPVAAGVYLFRPADSSGDGGRVLLLR